MALVSVIFSLILALSSMEGPSQTPAPPLSPAPALTPAPDGAIDGRRIGCDRETTMRTAREDEATRAWVQQDPAYVDLNALSFPVRRFRRASIGARGLAPEAAEATAPARRSQQAALYTRSAASALPR